MIMMTLTMTKMMVTVLMMIIVMMMVCTWHVAQAEVGDTVVVVEEDVEGVQGPGRLHQQARPQRHHQPGQANTIQRQAQIRATRQAQILVAKLRKFKCHIQRFTTFAFFRASV